MSERNLLLIGAGGHAGACIDVIEQSNSFTVAGLVVPPGDTQKECLGHRVLGTDDNLRSLAKRFTWALITVGHIQSAQTRKRLFQTSTDLGLVFPQVMSPHAHVSTHARIGAGTIIMHHALVNAAAGVGNNCIINTGALVEHDAVLSDHCHVSTRAVVNGHVHVGSGTFIGSGSVIKEGVVIGSNVVIGMGLSVRKNLPDNTRYLGQRV